MNLIRILTSVFIGITISYLIPACKTEPQPQPQPQLLVLQKWPEITFPEIKSPESYDKYHVVGEYETIYQHVGKYKTSRYENRAHNIKTNVANLEWIPIHPGDSFSYNKTVGPRTEEFGYMTSIIIYLGEFKEEYGGGTCQVSSTIHAAALMSGMEIVQRTSHSRPSTYIKRGFDATVSYPELDLVFKNPYPASIYLHAETYEVTEDLSKLRVVLYSRNVQIKKPIKKTRWISNGTEPYKKKFRKTNKWRTDHKTRIQRGKDGEKGILAVWYTDGRKERFVSQYRPVNEIWEVGLAWDMDQVPWEPTCQDKLWKCRKICQDKHEMPSEIWQSCYDHCGGDFLICQNER